MDNRSKVIGVAVAVAVVVTIVIIGLVVSSKSGCKLVDAEPKLSETDLAIQTSKDNSVAAEFKGYVTYVTEPDKDKKTKTNYVELSLNEVIIKNEKQFQLKADCATLTVNMGKDATGVYATSVEVEAFDGGKERIKCNLVNKPDSFKVPAGKYYNCHKTISYDCQDATSKKKVATVAMMLSFETGRQKDAPANKFNGTAENCPAQK